MRLHSETCSQRISFISLPVMILLFPWSLAAGRTNREAAEVFRISSTYLVYETQLGFIVMSGGHPDPGPALPRRNNETIFGNRLLSGFSPHRLFPCFLLRRQKIRVVVIIFS
ncbi:hypothetical protein V8C26DRAFT_403937 [Trichoderma gracile]